MKSLRSLVISSALFSLLPLAAQADTILLGSYGTTAVNTGVANSATVYSNATSTVDTGSTSTYNIDPASVWHAALGNSSYVSFNAGTGPGGSYIAPNGDYIYTVSFLLTSEMAANSVGTLSVLADDTVAVSLNGNLLLAAAGPMGATDTYSHCSDTGPNCIDPTTVALTGLIAGNNLLTFNVKQVNLAQEGLDFSGTITAIPEPASLALMSSGLLGAIGLVRRRLA